MEEDNKNFIIVLKSGNGESISVEVFPEDTVKDLKQRIETQVGIPLDFDQIKIDGKTFNDDTNIIEYFSSGRSLFLVTIIKTVISQFKYCPTITYFNKNN